MFEPHLKRWQLQIDGKVLCTKNAELLPVRLPDDTPAMLKLSHAAEERAGNALMAWWDGDGAAPVLGHDGAALLMKRAQHTDSLVDMANSGLDDEATRILCSVAARLHAPRNPPMPTLIPLTAWFEALWAGAERLGGLFELGALAAREVLATPRDAVVLHGDIHHGNVLDFGTAGWLAIDPKGLFGERGFDHANMLCNPDGVSALEPGRFARRIDVIVAAAGLEPRRLLQWALAWTSLSAVGMLEDGEAPDHRLQISRLAAAALDLPL